MDVKDGRFYKILRRTNKEIRQDRADQIVEAAELKYKREIEDIGMRIKDLQRTRDGLLDLSPTDTNSLVIASHFDADKWRELDLKLALQIRNEKIMLELAEERYNELFVNPTTD